MKIESFLKSEESIIKILYPKKSIPLRLEDWVKMPFFILFCIVISIVFKPYDSSDLHFKQLYYYLLLPLIVIFGFLMTIGKLFLRRLKTINSVYYITNQRVIIFNQHSTDTIKSFFFNQFPEIDYRENAYGFGYIILGKKEPLFVYGGRMGGINILEHKDVMNNIVDVKAEYDLIKKLTLNSQL